MFMPGADTDKLSFVLMYLAQKDTPKLPFLFLGKGPPYQNNDRKKFVSNFVNGNPGANVTKLFTAVSYEFSY